MRPCSLLLLLTITLPAAAENRTASIRLRHRSALEAQRILIGQSGSGPAPAPPNRGAGGGLGPAPARLLPDGVTALTADPEENSLSVVGDEASIEGVRKLVQLLDTPARRVELQIQVLGVTVEDLQDVGLERVGPAAADIRPGVANEKATARFAAAGALALGGDVRVVACDGQAAYFQWKARGKAFSTTLMPRVNGDGTVTLFISLPAASEEAPSPDWFAVRRVKPGSAVAVALPSAKAVLLVRPRVLPDPPAK